MATDDGGMSLFEYIGQVNIESFQNGNAFLSPVKSESSSSFSFEFYNKQSSNYNPIRNGERVAVRLSKSKTKDSNNLVYMCCGTAYRVDEGKNEDGNWCVISFGGLLGHFKTKGIEELDRVYLTIKRLN